MFIIPAVVASGQVVSFNNNGRPVKPGTNNLPSLGGNLASALSQSLCRDGWNPGAMKDFSGKQIPICFKINPEPQTWMDAQATCRKDYGFLLKLDSRASINNEDLLSYVIASGKWRKIETWSLCCCKLSNMLICRSAILRNWSRQNDTSSV